MRRSPHTLISALLLACFVGFAFAEVGKVHVDATRTALTNVEFDVKLKFSSLLNDSTPWPEQVQVDAILSGKILKTVTLYPYADGSDQIVPGLKLENTGDNTVIFQTRTEPVASGVKEFYVIPSALAIFPSIATVAVALWTKQVILALLSGLFVGAFLDNKYNPIDGFLRLFDTVLMEAIATTDHASVLYFSLALGGLIAIVSKGGGAVGMAESLGKFANTAKRAQLSTALVGLLIFFDDYSNALITGSTMRNISDRMKVSREKLSFIVHSFAATMASISVVSSWTGVEVSYIDEQFTSLGRDEDAYWFFLQSIPYCFYQILMIIFVFLTIFTGREFGPMLRAELESMYRTDEEIVDKPKKDADTAHELVSMDEFSPIANKPRRWYNGVIPIITLVFTILLGICLDGYYTIQDLQDDGEDIDLTLRDMFSNGNPFSALTWGAMFALVVSVVLLTSQKILTLNESMESINNGCKSMVAALLILIHAWALAEICERLQVANLVVSAIGDNVDPGWLPLIVFIVSAIVSFSTGSSWGTMAIMFPLVIPLADSLAGDDDNAMRATVASVMSGSVWGDHCSPISDTCILASMSTQCDHLEHVRTQLIYALTVAAVALPICYIPVGFGAYNPIVAILLGSAILFFILMYFGTPVDPATAWHLPAWMNGHSISVYFIDCWKGLGSRRATYSEKSPILDTNMQTPSHFVK